MTPEQRRRARIAVGVPSAYGLGAGVLSIVLGPPAAYLFGMLAMAAVLVAGWMVNAVLGYVWAWVMGGQASDEMLAPFWRMK